MWLYLSNFFNKTKKNISVNPFAYATITDPSNMNQYNLELQFDHSETEGELFKRNGYEVTSYASITGMTGIFELQAADVYKVLSIND